MGVKNLSKIFDEVDVNLRNEHSSLFDFKNKYLAFDGFIQLFQFLSTIRGSGGENMTDNEGRTTSHLIGILTRNAALLQHGIKPIYVFDGTPSPLKEAERERRRERTNLAQEEHDKAVAAGDMARAKQLASRINKLDKGMIEDAKTLLTCMGIPVIQAPGEGEAQAAALALEGTAYATASQDYDALLFGTPVLVRNITITGRRNLPGGGTKLVKSESINLEQLMNSLDLTREQLIDFGFMLGTDFNDGFKGIGPKSAFRFIKKYGSFRAAEKSEIKLQGYDHHYDEVKEIFMNPNVHKNLGIPNTPPFSKEKILKFLVDERGFNPDRYLPTIEKTEREIVNTQSQTDLKDWF